MRISLPALLAGGLAACSFVAASVQGSSIGIRSAQLTLASADGSNEKVEKLEYPKTSLKEWTLEEDSVLRLSFGIVDTANDQAFVPQRANIRFTDAQTAASTVLPLQLKAKGKARFDLRATALPASLRSSSGQLTMTIFLGHPSDIRPLEYTIGTISLPASRLLPLPKGRHDLSVKKEGEPAFVVQPEIHWTFSPEEKVISKSVSAIGTLIVIAVPLAVWGLMGGQVIPNLKTQSPSIASILFLISLVGLEALIVKYWINWRLYQFLSPFLTLGLISAYLGKVALGQEQKRRIATQTGKATQAAVVVEEGEGERKESSGKATKIGVAKAK